MHRIVFATGNKHKAREVQLMLPDHIHIADLDEIAWEHDIPETADTLKGNALLKARTVADALDVPCFADDTGLEVTALHGKPGVHSARYAGRQRSAEENMHKVLEQLDKATDRSAQFRTVIALIIDDANFFFEGIVKGHIAMEPRGEGGFGYDPIFIPEGFDKTFGVLPSEIKNEISHRAKATTQLVSFLAEYFRRKNPG